MGIERETLKRRRTEIRRTRPIPIPKLELAFRHSPEFSPRYQKFRRFGNLASLIRCFGEFTLVCGPDDNISAFWTSRETEGHAVSLSVLGRRLESIAHPRLVAEIENLASRTAVLGRREESEYQVTVLGRRKWFSVCAIPLDSCGENGSIICLRARDVTHRVEAMQAVVEREALLAHAEEIANFGSWEMDLNTKQIKLSQQLMKLYELAPGTRLSEDMFWERVHPGDRIRVRQIIDRGIADGRPFDHVSRYCAPDGRVRLHHAHTLPLQDQHGKTFRAIGVIQDVTEHEQSHEELRRLSQQLLSEQDTQRRQLARELHESAGQSLAALKMTLGRLRDVIAERSKLAASLLESAAQLADSAVREVRTVSYLLHPPLLDDAGLGPALRWYVEGFSRRSGIRVTLEITNPFSRYGQDIETTVFRVIQEALTNVHRYSGSASAEIRLAQNDSELCVEVRDHGCGFPPAADTPHLRGELGVGISGMRERVKQLDGRFELDSVPGQGTTVRVLLPAASGASHSAVKSRAISPG